MEKFKKSKKSICGKCMNINEKCSTSTSKMCDTDRSLSLAYVRKCSHFNKSMTAEVMTRKKNNMKCNVRPESRIDMMGGGH